MGSPCIRLETLQALLLPAADRDLSRLCPAASAKGAEGPRGLGGRDAIGWTTKTSATINVFQRCILIDFNQHWLDYNPIYWRILIFMGFNQILSTCFKKDKQPMKGPRCEVGHSQSTAVAAACSQMTKPMGFL